MQNWGKTESHYCVGGKSGVYSLSEAQGPIIVVFTGTFEHAIDAKQRLAIPSEIRSQIKREHDRQQPSGDPAGGDKSGPRKSANCEGIGLYVTLGESGSLSLYTETGFEKRAEALDDSPLESEELLAYERYFFSLARRVEMDTQGRVRLPENLLARTGLSGEVVLIGVKDHVEIRDRTAWNQEIERVLAERPSLLMNPRRAMRPGKDQKT